MRARQPCCHARTQSILAVAGIGVCMLKALRLIPSAAVILRKKGWLNGLRAVSGFVTYGLYVSMKHCRR